MRERFLPAVLLIGVVVGLTLILRDLLDERLITPLFYLAWVSGLILLSVPQSIIWGLFLIVALMIAARSLLRRRSRSKPTPPPRRIETGRIEPWLKLIRQAEQEPYYRWQLAQRLRNITLDALAHEMRLPLKQIRRKLTQDELDLPPDIQRYLQASRTSFGHFTPKRRLFSSQPDPSPLDLPPEKIAQFLEERFKL